jgi:hypothetical protein
MLVPVFLHSGIRRLEVPTPPRNFLKLPHNLAIEVQDSRKDTVVNSTPVLAPEPSFYFHFYFHVYISYSSSPRRQRTRIPSLWLPLLARPASRMLLPWVIFLFLFLLLIRC